LIQRLRWLSASCACAIAIFFLGCYSPERSLSLDPNNKPLIHIIETKYDVTSGKVLVTWVYIGREPVTLFEVQRRILGSFEAVARVDGNRDSAGYVFISSYQDEALLAGESVFYKVAAHLAGGGQEVTQTASVTVPGARAMGIVRDPVRLTVQFRWSPDLAIAAGYQVLRTIGDGAPVIIYETNDPALSSFTDESFASNEPHHYSVRTLTQSGGTLDSRSLTAQFYRKSASHPVETVQPPTERMRLGIGELTTSGGTLALVARQNQLSLFQFRYQVGFDFEGSPRILRTLVGIVFPNVQGLQPLSIDLAAAADISPFSVFPRVYIGGILSSGQIDIAGFEIPLFNRIWTMSNVWQSPPGTIRLRLAHDSQGRVYAAAGNEIRAFSDSGGFLGAESLTGSVTDMSVQGDQIWVVLDGSRLEYAKLEFVQGALAKPIWDPILFEEQSEIIALSHNTLGQALVLDGSRHEVVLLQSNGTVILRFGLPLRDYTYGDMVVDQGSGNLVQVTDGRGDVTTFIP